MNRVMLFSIAAMLIFLIMNIKCNLSNMETNCELSRMNENPTKFKTFNFFTLEPEIPLTSTKNLFPFVVIDKIDSGINIKVHLKPRITGNIFLNKKDGFYTRIVEFYPWPKSTTKEIRYYVYSGNGNILQYCLGNEDSILTFSVVRIITPEQISTYQFKEKTIESIEELPLVLSENEIKHYAGVEHYITKYQKLGNLYLKFYIKNDIETISEAYDLNGYDPFYIDYIPDVNIKRICIEDIVTRDDNQ